MHLCLSKAYLYTGHTAIPGNELVDRKAREVAHDISVYKISAPKEITVHEGYRMATVMLLKSWQHKWNAENTGCFTYSLMPNVNAKVVFPNSVVTAAGICNSVGGGGVF